MFSLEITRKKMEEKRTDSDFYKPGEFPSDQSKAALGLRLQKARAAKGPCLSRRAMTWGGTVARMSCKPSKFDHLIQRLTTSR